MTASHPSAADALPVPPADAETARNRQQFDRLAESYHAGQAQRLEGDRLRRLVGDNAGRALDVACGTGAASDAVRPLALSITGLDASPAMLEQARERLGDFPFDAVVGSAHALPFESDTFDTAVCSRALHHMTHPADTIAEMVRVVRPGGTIVITDNVLDESADIRERFDQLERLRDPSHASILPTDQISAALTEAGCQVEAVEHALQLRPLGEWFTDAGTDDASASEIRSRIEAMRGSTDAGLAKAVESKFVEDPDADILIRSQIVWLRATVPSRS